MSKPKKKPSVQPEQRREWLRLLDEEGRSVPQIATKSHYDVRTIRKAVQWARDDREKREARRLVYRQALEAHFADFVRFANKLDEEITRNKTISPTSMNSRLWNAMRQHLPRSPIWQSSKKLDDLNAEIEDLEEKLKSSFIKNHRPGSRDLFQPDRIGPGLNWEAVSGAYIHRLKTNYEGISPELRFLPHKPGALEINYGPYQIGVIPEAEKAVTDKYLVDLLIRPKMKTNSEKLKDKLSERKGTIEAISEEIAAIKLRRVLTGRCKYCPL